MEMIRKTDIKNKHVIMLRHVGAVCDILDEYKCGNLYSHIIQHLCKECGCQTIMDYVRQLIHDEYPCEEIFTCKIMFEIDPYNSIWSSLTPSEEIFLIRIMFRCTIAYATIAVLANLSFLAILLLVVLNLIYPAKTVLAPKSTAHIVFWLLCFSKYASTAFSYIPSHDSLDFGYYCSLLVYSTSTCNDFIA